MNVLKKMLVVDDVEVNRVAIMANMCDDYDIIEAENGKEALMIMNTQKIDVLVLDLFMPVMDGTEVLREMKKSELLTFIPVIVVSASDDTEKEIEVLNLGADEIIRKPFDGRVLKRRINNIMTVRSTEYIDNIRSQLQSVMDGASDAIYRVRIKDRLDKYVAEAECVNDEFFLMRGIRREDYIGRKILPVNWILGEDYKIVMAKIEEALHARQSRAHFEYRIKGADGNIKYVEARAGITYKSQESILDIIETDRTEKRRLQTQVTNLESKYEVHTKLFQVVLDTLPGSVTIYEVEQDHIRILFANEAMCMMLGYEKEEFLSKVREDALFLVHPEDRKELMARFRMSSVQSIGFEDTFRCMRKDGQYVWIKLYASAMERTNDKLIVYGSCSDVDTLIEKAEKDSLTGIFNRQAFDIYVKNDLLGNEKEGCTKTMLMIDIDYFKKVNDTFGHDFGDEVLKKVAHTLSGIFRSEDVVARLGGDEFCIYIAREISRKTIIERVKQVNRELQMAFEEALGKVTISASIGIAFSPQHGKTYKELYKSADTAQYLVKKNGKNGFCIFGECRDHE